MYHGGMTLPKKKRGRPYGQNFTRAIRVRFPPEVDFALRKARRLFGISIAEFVRAGVMQAFADTVPRAVAALDDPKTTDK